MSSRFDDLVQLMARLRAPDGCPWDRKQSHASLKPYLLEEAYEVLETIDGGDTRALREELGDLLLQTLFHAQIARETGVFTIDDVLEGLADKLVRRHPHVFGDGREKSAVTNAEEVVTRWEDIKRRERRDTGKSESALNGVPKTLPALLRAYQVQARASRVGFDWPHTAEGIEQVLGKIAEEIRELREALDGMDLGAAADNAAGHRVEAEFGDLLFALVNLARFIKVNPEEALRRATNRFVERFQFLEAAAARAARRLEDMTLAEMDALWEQAKRATRNDADGTPKKRSP